jgi:hypothetical protein
MIVRFHKPLHIAGHWDAVAKKDGLMLWCDALEESANLPAPEISAADITADLEAAMEQFATIAEDMKK